MTLRSEMDATDGLRAVLIPMCAWCRRTRDEQGAWSHDPSCFHEQVHTDFTHGICPDCMARELGGIKRRMVRTAASV